MIERPTIGKHYHYKPENSVTKPINRGRFVLDKTREFYHFDAVPFGKPRMTQSDKWRTNPNHKDPNKRQRKPVTEYFRYKDSLLWQAKSIGYEMGDYIDVVFFIPFPESYSKKKKEELNGMPHLLKPDTDNLVKALKDIFKGEDSVVWLDHAEKRWAFKGSIIIYI